jgi:transcriptional regulator with XRE-family HTH domain
MRGQTLANLAEMLGSRLREVRKQKGLRQEDLEKYGVSYKYYQRIEGGKVNITLSTIEKIAEALQVEPTELFAFPLSNSKEVNELYALVADFVANDDKEAVKKMVVFIRQILG